MKDSVMISPDLLIEIGLPDVLEACHCRTAQGNRLKNETRFYGKDAKLELEPELDAIERLLPFVQKKDPQVIEAQTQLSRLRELRGTLSRLEKGSSLDDSELFELKGALTIFFRVSRLKQLLAAAGVNFQVTKEASDLLDPSGTRNPSFYIYSEYSPFLAEIREAKRKLEKEIAISDSATRQSLLTQRGLLIAKEDREEESIRKNLVVQLSAWLPQIRHNLLACALLDFRLAKAALAVRWRVSKPELVEPDSPTLLQNAVHPLIESQLKHQGLDFTPVTVSLWRGATVISGANMGGKSVALKTIFLAHLMTQLGYFPTCERLVTPLFDFFAFESSQDGDLNRGLSSFGLEAVQIRNHHRRSQRQDGLILMDEPCRGTNPIEATAIVQALCNTYGRSTSRLLIATHYHVEPEEGIRFYQVRGIRPEALEKLSVHPENPETLDLNEKEFHSSSHEDLRRVRKIQNMMDYRLEELRGPQLTPSGAIKIAELLGVDQELLNEMRKAWQEEQWQNLD